MQQALNALVQMVTDPATGKLRPRSKKDASGTKTIARLPLAEVMRVFKRADAPGFEKPGGGPYIQPDPIPVVTRETPEPAPQPEPAPKCQPEVCGPCYSPPGYPGPCDPRVSGIGHFGLHQNLVGGVVGTQTVTSPQRDILAGVPIADAANLAAWLLTEVRILEDRILHGNAAPLSVFHPHAAHPISFDAKLCTSDRVFITTLQNQVAVLTTPNCNITLGTCFKMSNPDWACPPIRRDNRSYILGLGVANFVEAAGAVGLLTVAPSERSLLGWLILDGSYNGVTPDQSPRAGEVGANMQSALEFIDITQIDINAVNIFTTRDAVAGQSGIPARAFGPTSLGMFFNFEVDSSKVVNVTGVNNVAANAIAGANTITLAGAVVGCIKLG